MAALLLLCAAPTAGAAAARVLAPRSYERGGHAAFVPPNCTAVGAVGCVSPPGEVPPAAQSFWRPPSCRGGTCSSGLPSPAPGAHDVDALGLEMLARSQVLSTATTSDVVSGTAASYGAAFGDVDGDGRLDLIVVNSGQPNELYMNAGGGALTRVTSGDVVSGTALSFGAAFGDVDGDGRLDLSSS